MSKLARTSHSFYENRSSPTKINFQTKLKIRGTNEYLQKSNPGQDYSHREQSSTGQSELLRINKSMSCFDQTKN